MDKVWVVPAIAGTGMFVARVADAKFAAVIAVVLYLIS